jgi:hypothetical protein
MKFLKHSRLPKWIDLRSKGGCPAVINKLELNTSSVSSVCNAIRFLMKQKNMKDFLPSRLYLYYFSRLIENKLENNREVKFRNIFKAIKNYGICSEKDYQYDFAKVNDKPNIVGTTEINFRYTLIKEDIHEIKIYLNKNLPIVFNFDIFTNFYNEDVSKTGYIKMPKHKERPIGKSSATIYGYRNSSKSFICMNNIGNEWGDRGFFYLPYEYVKKYAYDFYVLTI